MGLTIFDAVEGHGLNEASNFSQRVSPSILVSARILHLQDRQYSDKTIACHEPSGPQSVKWKGCGPVFRELRNLINTYIIKKKLLKNFVVLHSLQVPCIS